MTDTIEQVELDPGTVDEIADRVALKMRGPDPYTTPKRSQLEPGGIVPKPGDSGAKFTGGDDMYSLAGTSEADTATNLFLVKMLLETSNPRTGRPFALASPRLVEVMTKSAERALSQPTIAIPRDEFTTKSYAAFRQEARQKAMTSTGATTGDEWVPTFASAELWRDIHAQTVVANALRRVTMPTNPYTLPTQEGSVTWRYVSTENTAATASTVATDKATLTAAKVMAEVDFSGEFTEDSIIPVVPALRADLTRSGAQTIDDLCIHGDTATGGTGNVNSDDAAPAAESYYLALDGIRKFTVVTNTAQTANVAGAITAANFNTTRQLMGKYGARASDLIVVAGWTTIGSMLGITEVLTVDKYGPQATILNGELGKFYGIPLLPSEAIPGTSTDKVAADGKYTTTTPASNDTTGWYLIINTRMWVLGFRRELTIESFRDIQKDQNILVASLRQAFVPNGVSTLIAAGGRNVTV